jgi:hypothetical protein
VNDYIQQVKIQTGKTINRKDIWSGHYADDTEFQRWQRGDRRTTAASRRIFERLLVEKPHLK